MRLFWTSPRRGEGPPPGPRLSLRRGQTLLALLLLYLAIWDMAAIARDNRLLLTDSLLEDMTLLGELPQTVEQFGAWFEQWTRIKKGPLIPAASLGVIGLLGVEVLAARLITLLAHWAAMIALFAAGRRLSGRVSVGLWAALIFGTFPGAYGWGRIGTYDPLAAPFLLACLTLMMSRTPTVKRMILLGVTAGLATMTRTSFPLFAGAPALLFTIDQLRRPGRRWLPLWAIGAALLVTAWWLFPALNTLTHYAGDSSYLREETHLAEQLVTYLFDIPGTSLLYLAAAIGALVTAILRPSARAGLLMAGAAIVVPMALLLTWFDPLPRYAVPTFSLAALLAAAGLVELWARFKPPALLPWIVAAILLGVHAFHNSGGYADHERGREMGAGMVTADTRRYDAWPRVARYCHENELTLYRLFDPMFYNPCPTHTGRAWRDRGIETPEDTEPERTSAAFTAGKSPLHLLICHRDIGAIEAMNQQLITAVNEESSQLVSRLMAGRKELLFTAADPYADTVQGDIKLSVVRITSP